MKRSAAYPDRRSVGEFKQNIQKQYSQFIQKPSKINPIFLADHYGIKKGVQA